MHAQQSTVAVGTWFNCSLDARRPNILLRELKLLRSFIDQMHASPIVPFIFAINGTCAERILKNAEATIRALTTDIEHPITIIRVVPWTATNIRDAIITAAHHLNAAYTTLQPLNLTLPHTTRHVLSEIADRTPRHLAYSYN